MNDFVRPKERLPSHKKIKTIEDTLFILAMFGMIFYVIFILTA
jgi:hypothetical protein